MTLEQQLAELCEKAYAAFTDQSRSPKDREQDLKLVVEKMRALRAQARQANNWPQVVACRSALQAVGSYIIQLA